MPVGTDVPPESLYDMGRDDPFPQFLVQVPSRNLSRTPLSSKVEVSPETS